MPIAILALALSAFAVGTTEFVIVGVIPDVASDLSVSIPTAGLLVSAYALTVAVGTPIVTALTGRFDRRKLLLALMLAFVLTNVIAAGAPNFPTLLGARMFMAVSHGVFFGVATTAATSFVPREKAGAAVSAVLSGITVAMVLGVPIGSWIGNTFSWRIPFLAVAVFGTIGLISIVVLIPKVVEHVPPAGLLAQFAVLRHPRLLGVYAVTVLGIGGTFVVFTYLSPFLTSVTKAGEGTVSVALVVFGVGTVVGTYTAGKVVDRWGTRLALIASLTGTVITLAALPFTSHSVGAVLVNIGLWGAFGFALPPIISAGAVAIAEDEAPNAVSAAAGFSVAAINLGISSGSFLGGRLLQSVGIRSTPWVAVVVVLGAVVIAGLIKLKREAAPRPPDRQEQKTAAES